MPYKSEWTEPEVALKHEGVKVYHTYEDDDFDQGPQTFWFVMDPSQGPDDAFDVRDLPTWKEPPHPPYITGKDDTLENRAAWEKYHAERVEENAILDALRGAIERGLIPQAENKKEEVPSS